MGARPAAHRVKLRARREQLFTYSGRSVLVTDLAGQLSRQDPHGLYVDNTRVLSCLETTIDGHSPNPIAASPVTFELAVHPEADFADSEEAEQRRRLQTAETETTWEEPSRELRIRYCHPRLDLAVAVKVERSPQPPR